MDKDYVCFFGYSITWILIADDIAWYSEYFLPELGELALKVAPLSLCAYIWRKSKWRLDSVLDFKIAISSSVVLEALKIPQEGVKGI